MDTVAQALRQEGAKNVDVDPMTMEVKTTMGGEQVKVSVNIAKANEYNFQVAGYIAFVYMGSQHQEVLVDATMSFDRGAEYIVRTINSMM